MGSESNYRHPVRRERAGESVFLPTPNSIVESSKDFNLPKLNLEVGHSFLNWDLPLSVGFDKWSIYVGILFFYFQVTVRDDDSSSEPQP